MTCFVYCQTICIASRISASETVMISGTCSRMIAKVRSERPVRRPSATVVGGSEGCRTPVVRERAASSARSGSAPSTVTPVCRPWVASAVPDRSPPPPTGATTKSSPDTSDTSSSAAVPAPAITASLSNGCISTAPVRATTSASVSARDSGVFSQYVISAPYASTAAFLTVRTDSGITTYAGIPRVAAASASAAA